MQCQIWEHRDEGTILKRCENEARHMIIASDDDGTTITVWMCVEHFTDGKTLEDFESLWGRVDI